MTKKNKTPFGIFIEAIGLYFSNFIQFVKYMTFPVLGQIIGLVLVLFCTYTYSQNIPSLIEKYKIFDNFNTLVIVSVIVALPGMIIFMKAFWEYLVAYGAINSMLDNMLKSGKVYDFNAHTELIKRRSLPFIGLWFVVGIFTVAAYFPLFWIPAGIVFVYAVLTFQTFTYEPDLSPIGSIKKSFDLIKGYFPQTFLLITLSCLLTWFAIPQAFNKFFAFCGATEFISKLFTPIAEILPLNEINLFMAKFNIPSLETGYITSFITTTIIAQIIIQYTLPLRSILCGLWYKELSGSIIQKTAKKKSSKKRPSEKLMEESHKKFVSKRIDKNILKRAMEKDDKDS